MNEPTSAATHMNQPDETATAERWLLSLTGLPTAAGCEQQVIAWVRQWAAGRPHLSIRADRYGNLLITHRKAPLAEGEGERGEMGVADPILFTAHMDHPAFVVTAPVRQAHRVQAVFRGGVAESYFPSARVRLHRGRTPPRGTVIDYSPPDRESARDAQVSIAFESPVTAETGDVLTWDLPRPRIRGDRLTAPACDDLAAVAAALATLDRLGDAAAEKNVGVLLTRAEEVGFIGAMAACHAGTIPPAARLIALENSRAFRESPIGGGPIVRVGDRSSTFDPALTRRVAQVAERLAMELEGFCWQRKLMPGGTCEATAFCEFGYAATCVCLPLGNYHNMADRGRDTTPRIRAESISLCDYHNLIHLLVRTAHDLDATEALPPLRSRLENLYRGRIALLEAPPGDDGAG